MQPAWVQAVHTLILPHPGKKPEAAPLQQSLGQLSHWKPRPGRVWHEGLQSRLYLGIARARRGSELNQIPTSSLRRPAKTVKNTALGLRSSFSLGLLTQEVPNIRLQLCCSGSSQARSWKLPTQSDTFCLQDVAHGQRQAELDV